MTPRVESGWLIVPCDESDRAHIHIAIGKNEPGRWHPAFRDWDTEGNRVAKIRLPAGGNQHVWLQVNGTTVKVTRRPVAL